MDDARIRFIEQMKHRTKQVALRVIRVQRELPQNQEGWVLGKQLLRSGTSLAANYRAACKARSGKEYYAKLSIATKECDEALFWPELQIESEIMPEKRLATLMQEINEILVILMKSRQTIKKSLRN